MRAAITIESFRPGPGGVEGVAWQLARELGRRGVDLTVICRTATRETLPGVRVETLGGPRFWQPLRVLEFSRRASRASRSGRFDVVQAFSRTRHQDVYRTGGGSHAAYMESVYAWPRLRAWLSPRHRVLLSIEEAVFRDRSQLLLCNSRFVADEIIRRYGIEPARCTVIHNGVDLETFHPRERERSGAAVRRELSLEGPVVLFLGAGFRRKGLDRALAGLAASGVPATLLVAGGDDPAPWRRMASSLGIAERVRFLGSRSDPAALCAAADLLVLPTRYDTFGMAVIEAMACGTGVATTPQAGSAELVVPGENGFVLDEDFAPAFAALSDVERLHKLGAAARETAERHSWSAYADRVLALWSSLQAGT